MRQKCRIEAVVGYSAPRDIVARELKCSYPYPAGRNALERAGLGIEVQAMILYVEPPETGEQTIATGHRVIIKDNDFRIQHVSLWPEIEPVYVELVIQAESD